MRQIWLEDYYFKTALLVSSDDNDELHGRIKFVIIGIKIFSSTRIDEFQDKNVQERF